MLNINFVPDDYVQSSESKRTNLMYLVLFGIVMIGLGGTFTAIRVRQRMLGAEERIVNEKLTKAKEAIEKYEQLQGKQRIMMKSALATADLIEPVSNSILIASLTNNLPSRTSLIELKLIKKSPTIRKSSHVPSSKYNAQKQGGSLEDTRASKERHLQTIIDIEGIAPSDLEVAAYIKKLTNSSLLRNVALVESKESQIEDTVYRRFKLKAMLSGEIHLTDEEIERIRAGGESSGSWRVDAEQILQNGQGIINSLTESGDIK